MENGHGQKYSFLKEKGLVALLLSTSIPEAAGKTGVHPITLQRWLEIDEFQEMYNQAKQKVLCFGILKLQSAISTAVTTLVEIMETSKNNKDRINSARCILEMAFKAVDTDMQMRINNMENIVDKLTTEEN
jgi:hypothetical protein